MEFLDLVKQERDAQRKKWHADDQYSVFDWAGLLSRYVGRVAESACGGFKVEDYRTALVKLAAVAMAAFENDGTNHD